MPPGTRPRVLCVDDDEDSRVMLVALLRLAFIEAKAVGTAAQALSLIQAEHFDLYMLDGWLPEIDGFELCRRLRAFDPRIPILFFSGAAYESDKRKGIEAGANDYVIKPNIFELVRSVKRLTLCDVLQPADRKIRLGAEALNVSGASDACVSEQVKIPQLRLVNLPCV
jgi:two-component system, OmpR family, response regulator